MDNTLVTGTRGCVILFPPRCMHSIALEKDILSSQYDVIKFDPGLLPSCKMDVLDLRAVLHSVHVLHCPCLFSPEQVQEMNLEPLFSEILLEYQRRDFVSSMILTADLRKIVSKLVRFWQKDKNYFSVSGVHPSYEVSFDRICEYIDTHYFDELTVKSLAAMCGLSHSTFSLNFYRRYQMTCKEYITTTRINAAENMLLFSNHDVSFIAHEVGYTDCSYFIRCYKKIKGITPKQARKLRT